MGKNYHEKRILFVKFWHNPRFWLSWSFLIWCVHQIHQWNLFITYSKDSDLVGYNRVQHMHLNHALQREYSSIFRAAVYQPLSHVGLCDPMGHSTAGFSVLHYLPEFVQTHAHTAHEVLKPRMLKCFAIPFSSGPHFVGTPHYDPSVLGVPTWHDS